jgi:hypothetical protein
VVLRPSEPCGSGSRRGESAQVRAVCSSPVLVDETIDCVATVDLGCGRGEYSAVLARAGQQTTLIAWSHGNFAFSRAMYRRARSSGSILSGPDITRRLLPATDSIDAAFSCGVFEYFTAVSRRSGRRYSA